MIYRHQVGSMTSKEAEITIELEEQHKVYVPLETVTAHIHIKALEDIEYKNIEVQFEGVSHSEVHPKKAFNRGGTVGLYGTNAKRTTHSLFYKHCTIFPSQDVKESTKAKSFLLQSGEYDRRVVCKLPLYNDCLDMGDNDTHTKEFLPPSMSFGEDAYVVYKVRVLIRVPSMTKSGIYASKTFFVTQFNDPKQFSEQALLMNESFVFKNNSLKELKYEPSEASKPKPLPPGSRAVPWTFEIRNPTKTLIQGQPAFQIFITSPYGPERYERHKTSFWLKNLTAELVRTIGVSAQGAGKQYEEKYALCDETSIGFEIDLADLRQSPQVQNTQLLPQDKDQDNKKKKNSSAYELEIPNVFSNIIPQDITPSFETCNIRLSYKLRIRATFTEVLTERNNWNTGWKESPTLETHVKVVSDELPPEEYLNLIRGELGDHVDGYAEVPPEENEQLPQYKE